MTLAIAVAAVRGCGGTAAFTSDGSRYEPSVACGAISKSIVIVVSGFGLAKDSNASCIPCRLITVVNKIAGEFASDEDLVGHLSQMCASLSEILPRHTRNASVTLGKYCPDCTLKLGKTLPVRLCWAGVAP